MQRPTLLTTALCTLSAAFGQMVLPSGTNLTVDEGTSLRVEAPLTWTLETGSGAVNNGSIVLGPDADVYEALGAAMTGTGTERTTRDLSGPLVSEDPGGLGGIITTNASLGTTVIERGHLPYTDYSGHMSIARWIDFSPTNNNGLGATLDFRYDPAELNGLAEAAQRLHIRAGQDVWWFFGSSVDTGTHTVSAYALDSLGLFTTFDENLPNAVSAEGTLSGFALLGAPGEGLYLRVPNGARAETLDVFSINGALIATLAPHWGEGLYALPELASASGVYQLRVNGQRTLPFLRP